MASASPKPEHVTEERFIRHTLGMAKLLCVTHKDNVVNIDDKKLKDITLASMMGVKMSLPGNGLGVKWLRFAILLPKVRKELASHLLGEYTGIDTDVELKIAG